MRKEMITGRQIAETVGWLTRLTKDDYNERSRWLERLSNPSFDLASLDRVLIPTTYGEEIVPPFDEAVLADDGPGDEAFDATKLQLVTVLHSGEDHVKLEWLVMHGQANPATNWGQRAMEKIWRNRESISTSVWPISRRVFFPKTIWRDYHGNRCVWYIGRGVQRGWYREHYWFYDLVHSGDQLPSLRE